MAKYGDEDSYDVMVMKRLAKYVGFGILFIVAITALFGSFYTIPSGQEGVLLTFGKADMVAIQPGLHFKIPFVQSVVRFDIRTQKYGVDATQNTLESAASSDLQMVKVRIALNYHLTPGTTPQMWSTLGSAYEDKVILPTIHESVKASTAQFTAADLINRREDVRMEIERLMRAKLAPYNIMVEQVSITDFDFSEQFNAAIEAKVTAEQQAQKAQNDLQRIKIEAEQRIADAEGQKLAAIAVAQGEAEKVRLVQQQLMQSPQYIEYIKALKWNGAYPNFLVMGGSAPNFLMSVPSVSSANATAY